MAARNKRRRRPADATGGAVGTILLAARLGGMLGGLIICLPLHYGWKLARRRSPWPRRFLGWVGRCAGMRVETVGRPLGSHVLFVSNHVSWVDIMLIAGTTGAAFVARDDLGRWPVIGWLARLNDTVFVAREDRRAVRGQADALRNALATGQPVALFPEGTTEGGHQVLPFRPSLLASLMPPLDRVRVQPVAIDYGPVAHRIAWVGREPGTANARRILSRRGTVRVVLSFLAPIDPHEAGDRKQLAQTARAEIVAALDASAPGDDPL